MDYFFDPHTEAAFNLAFEEVLFERLERDTLMLWRNDRAIIVGCNQNTRREINSDYVRQQNVAVVRRQTGGGAVYHDLGNLNYSFFLTDPAAAKASFADLAEPVAAALRQLGVPAECRGRNDIAVSQSKVSGCARRVSGSRTLFHGTLLFDVDLTEMTRLLTPDPEKLIDKGVASVRSRVLNLHEILPDWTMDDFILRFAAALGKEVAAREIPFPAKLAAAAESVAAARYRRHDWNFSSPIPFHFYQKRRFPGVGTIEAAFDVEHDKISRLELTGDFFGELPASVLAAGLEGCVLERSALLERLAALPLERYIFGLTPADLAGLFE